MDLGSSSCPKYHTSLSLTCRNQTPKTFKETTIPATLNFVSADKKGVWVEKEVGFVLVLAFWVPLFHNGRCFSQKLQAGDHSPNPQISYEIAVGLYWVSGQSFPTIVRQFKLIALTHWWNYPTAWAKASSWLRWQVSRGADGPKDFQAPEWPYLPYAGWYSLIFLSWLDPDWPKQHSLITINFPCI